MRRETLELLNAVGSDTKHCSIYDSHFRTAQHQML